jgi:rhodanese-related sulfurtransferase
MDPRSAFARTDELNIIDVREPFEWQAGRIEGAQHIPMGDIPARCGEIGAARPLVAICRSGTRSAEVTEFLRDQGFTIDNLEGGMKAWVKAGLPIVGPDGGPGKVV